MLGWEELRWTMPTRYTEELQVHLQVSIKPIYLQVGKALYEIEIARLSENFLCNLLQLYALHFSYLGSHRCGICYFKGAQEKQYMESSLELENGTSIPRYRPKVT